MAPGLQAGFTVSRTVAETIHPYVGVRVNPVGRFGSTDGDLWLNGGAGVSWRPRLGKVEGVFGIEGTGAYGLNACLSATRNAEGGLDLQRGGCGTWNVALSAGVGFGRGAR